MSSVVPLPLSACCGVGSWSRLNSCQSVREAVCWLPRHSPSLPASNLPRPAWFSVTESSSSWINAYCGHIISEKNTLPDLHPPPPPPEPQNSTQQGSDSDYLRSALLTLCTSTAIGSFPSTTPGTMVPLCPDTTNGLGFQLILLLFKRKKKGRHQHRIGGSGHSLQWLYPFNIIIGIAKLLNGHYRPLTYVRRPSITEER